MYIDNTNLLRRPRTHSHWKFNKQGKAQHVFSNAALWLIGVDYNVKDYAHGLVDLSDRLVLPQFFKNLKVCRDIKVVYTKLDLTQTRKQLQKNKYYKTFIGNKQIIKDYE